MNEDPDLAAAVQEIQAKSARVQAALTQIRGTGTAANGTIIATVDSSGHLRDLALPRNTTQPGPQLAALILEATVAAEKDAAQQAARALRPLTSDHRVQAGLTSIRATIGTPEPAARLTKPMTDAEIQAADDAYFEKRNMQGGWT
jgi:DNA-binding protein YbaB